VLRVYEIRTMKRLSGPKRDEVKRSWRKQLNTELRNLHSLSNVIKMNKSKRIKWIGHAACTGRRRIHIGFWWESHKTRNHWKDLDIGRRIIPYCFQHKMYILHSFSSH
jgi:hypothetical protein